jgi:uncharacterized protein YndB with AHSA1/START domain
MDRPYIIDQVYNTPIGKVWQALTNQDAMKVWYFPQLKRFEPLVGFEMEFDDDGSSFKKQWQVTQVISGSKLAHTWTYQGYPGLSEVTFELFKEGSSTRLKLTQSGLASFPNDPHFARYRFEEGWKWIIGDKLKYYLEALD